RSQSAVLLMHELVLERLARHELVVEIAERPAIAGHLGEFVGGTHPLRGECAVSDSDRGKCRAGLLSRRVVRGLAERTGAVEVVISPPVPEHLAEERDAIDRGRRIAGGHLRRDSEEIERTGCADVGRVVRIWIDILEAALELGQSRRSAYGVGGPKE